MKPNLAARLAGQNPGPDARREGRAAKLEAAILAISLASEATKEAQEAYLAYRGAEDFDSSDLADCRIKLLTLTAKLGWVLGRLWSEEDGHAPR